VLKAGREDRGQLLHRFPVILEHRRALSARDGLVADRQRGAGRRVERARVRADPLRLSLANADALARDRDVVRRVGRTGRADDLVGGRGAAVAVLELAGVSDLLPRPVPLVERSPRRDLFTLTVMDDRRRWSFPPAWRRTWARRAVSPTCTRA